MVRSNFQAPRRFAGVSLVELMIGMLIGMIAVVVMMQVFSVSEGFKRTTTGGDDAQNTGAIGLYGLRRDMQHSGHVAGAFPVIGCNIQLRAGVTLNAWAPVTINHAGIPAGDANTDTLVIVSGSGNGSMEGDRVEAQLAQTTYTVAAAAAASGIGSISINDNVVVQADPRPNPCNLTMEPVTALAATNVSVGTGVAGMAGGILYNLGPTPSVQAYAVRNGNLTVCDYIANDCSAAANVNNAAIWVPIASNIVSLRAEYGSDATVPMDGFVDAYSPVTPATACGWARVSAIRVALIARSSQYDRDNVTAAAPLWQGSASSPVVLSGFADWQHFRYKIFQTVVPLRNMAWQGAQQSC